jgi:hypothetical protein
MPAWNYRLYGTEADPLRQSDLSALASSHSCPKKFAYEKEEQVTGVRERTSASWKACIGTATHETCKRILTRAVESVLAGKVPPIDQVLAVLNTELERAAEGLPINWRNGSRGTANPSTELMKAAHMVRGAVREVGKRAKRIVLVEAPFKLALERDGKVYHLTGTLDLAYETHDGKLVLVDWKTGEQLMVQVILDHGYQFGIYAEALARGVFYPGEYREVVIGRYPDEIYVGHLRDFVPYEKLTDKAPTRREQLEHFGISEGQKVKVPKGQERGPGWYRANRTEADRARLIHSVHTIVGTVRLGRFVEHIDEGCAFCPHRAKCFGDGFAPMGSEKAALEKNLAGLDFDGFGDEAA